VTVPRALFVLMLLVATALLVVAFRGESAKAWHRIQRLDQRQVELRQRLWAQELNLARLRVPDEIRQRAGRMGLELVPPEGESPKAKDASGR
jgi:hypothetical protein